MTVNSRPKTLFIGGYTDWYIIAKNNDIDLVVIQRPEFIEPEHIELCLEVHGFDYRDTDKTLELSKHLHLKFEFDSIICLNELGLITAAVIAEELKIPGMPHPDVVRRIRNKSTTREALSRANIKNPAFKIVESTNDLINFALEVGFPVIVKPFDGVGSLNVRAYQTIDAVINECDFQYPMLAEKLLIGQQISIESYSFNSQVIIYGINEEFNNPSGHGNPFLEVAHQMPAVIKNISHAELLDFLSKALSALDLENGPAHTELFLTESGIYLIETHCRFGGDGLPELVSITSGVDIIELALRWPLGLMPLPPKPRDTGLGAAQKFFTPAPGLVKSIDGIDASYTKFSNIEIVLNVGVGDTVSPLLNSIDPDDRVGYVRCVDVSPTLALSICNEVLNTVQISTSQFREKLSPAS